MTGTQEADSAPAAPGEVRDTRGGLAPEPDAPTSVAGRYLPGLDGLRGLSMIIIFAYHLGWGRGTYLAVDVFFALSGFLITSLLLEERVRTGRIDLPKFWGRRARRLLPALFVLLVGVGLVVVLLSRFGAPGTAAQFNLGELRSDGLATLFYVANWHAIFSHQSYFAQFQQVSPLLHTWTLAIEEQFYLIWPPVLYVVLRRLVPTWRRRVLWIAVTGALASAALMAALHTAGMSASRLYYGTDTRAFDLLIGAALAAVTAARAQPGRRARRRLQVAGPLAAAVLAVFFLLAGSGSGAAGGNGQPSSWMYDGGFLICAVLIAVVIADVRLLQPGLLGRALSWRPLRWVGIVSYGLYLWHWPVIVFMTPSRMGISGAWLDLVRIATATGLAAASYYLVERPIRQRRFASGLRRAAAPAAIALTAVILVLATDPAVVVPATASTSASALAPPTGEVPGTGWPASEVAASLPAGTTLSASHPLRVLILGDSVMETAEPAIARALQATGVVTVVQQAFVGWGLSTDTGWRTQFPQLVAEYHPNVVLASWSWDDTWATEHPSQYRRILEEAMDDFLAPKGSASSFIVLQQPLRGRSTAAGLTASIVASQNAGIARFDRIVLDLVHAKPGRVMFLPTSPAVEHDGAFSYWLPPGDDPGAPSRLWTRVRMVDGTHLCPAGAVRYGAAVLADFQKLFHLPAATSGWWNGSWVDSSRYFTPPGSCPDDHPS